MHGDNVLSGLVGVSVRVCVCLGVQTPVRASAICVGDGLDVAKGGFTSVGSRP